MQRLIYEEEAVGEIVSVSTGQEVTVIIKEVQRLNLGLILTAFEDAQALEYLGRHIQR